MTIKIVDPHVHLFDLQKGQYHWLKAENPPFWNDKALIRRSFNQADLQLQDGLILEGCVHIEAGFNNQCPIKEVEWLASSVTMPFKCVAGFPVDNLETITSLIDSKHANSLVGIRHILDDNVLPILQNPEAKSVLAFLADNQLSFDAQFSMANTQACKLITAMLSDLPNLRIIVNHGGWPDLTASKESNRWKTNLFDMAKMPNVAIKLSGWEMLDRGWDINVARMILDTAIEAFGPNRVMLASNFPLCLFSQSYQHYWSSWVNALSAHYPTIVHELVNANAKHWYKMS